MAMSKTQEQYLKDISDVSLEELENIEKVLDERILFIQTQMCWLDKSRARVNQMREITSRLYNDWTHGRLTDDEFINNTVTEFSWMQYLRMR